MSGYSDIRSPFPQAANTQRVVQPHRHTIAASGVFQGIPFPLAYIPRKVTIYSLDPAAFVAIAFHAGGVTPDGIQSAVQLTPGQPSALPLMNAPPCYFTALVATMQPVTLFFDCEVQLRTSVPTL